MNKVCNDNYDPRYAHVTEDAIIEMDSIYGRHLRWTYERCFRKEDLSYMWYRNFVSVADFANLIPQFRQLSIDDKCQLFRLNFSNISWIFYYDDLIDDELILGFPLGNGAYVSWDQFQSYAADSLFKPNSKTFAEDYKKFILTSFDPFKNIDVDEKEMCLLKTILLFQFEENLSDSGLEICQRMNNLLIDTLWDYQSIRFPELSFEEKLRRHSKFLLLIPKIGQAWHMESDIHLLMSIFGEMNIDGVVKELLFYNSTFESKH
uniref:NR LBD domain-containing protein n=1 Tax=Acrobeloides nanus TaxID=290746 RepID=A0A914E131_9BILA